MTSEFDDWLERFVDSAGPGVSVGIELKGRRVFEATRGLANVEWRTLVDRDTIFRIASLTKQFTAAAVVRLAEEGKLGLDEPIERHLPGFGTVGKTVTVRQLLTHMSGIGDYTEDADFMTNHVRNDHSTAELVEIIRKLPSDFEPGARCLYKTRAMCCWPPSSRLARASRTPTTCEQSSLSPSAWPTRAISTIARSCQSGRAAMRAGRR